METVREQMIKRLAPLAPVALDIVDDSAAHAGHAGAAAHAARTGTHEGTHFEIRVVSSAFDGKPLVARHRMIYELLGDLMKNRIHALKIDARGLS
jgi:BolA family transcriptional regulator, general stress-responsive regulator